jgi:hypothetical protein
MRSSERLVCAPGTPPEWCQEMADALADQICAP